MIIKKILHKLLEIPIVFQLQQKICNNYDAVLNEFSEYLNTTNKSIIEIGCSTANCASEIVNMSKNYYVGVDLDKNYIDRAKKNAPQGNFYEMDARKLSFENNKFDIAIFNGVIHHMDDDLILSCLSEVKRVLKENGKVLISEPIFSKGIISTILLKLDSIAIYPNPTNNSFTINYSTRNKNHTSQISINNILGEEIYSILLPTNKTHLTWTWHGFNNNGNPVPNGIYFISIQNGNQIQTKKVTLLK